MIKYRKLPENILELLPGAASCLASRFDVVFSYIFGSLSYSRPAPLSDIDIAVYLRPDTDLVESKLAILGQLMDRLRTEEIDLVILNRADPTLVINILRTKKVIVDKEPFLRHGFESVMMRKYLDFSIFESALLKRRYLNG